MRKVYLNSFASLVSKRNDNSLMNAICRMVEDHDAPFWYSRIRSGVKSFFGENLDYSILDSLLVKLGTVVPLTTFQKNDCENSKEAVRLISNMSFDCLKGRTLLKPAAKSIPFYGVELDVNPDAIIMWKDQQGKYHVGAIKTKLKKSAFKKEEATMIACMIKYYLHTLFPEYEVEDDYCICYDAFRSKFYRVTDYSKNLLIASSIAQRIAAMAPVAA